MGTENFEQQKPGAAHAAVHLVEVRDLRVGAGGASPHEWREAVTRCLSDQATELRGLPTTPMLLLVKDIGDAFDRHSGQVAYATKPRRGRAREQPFGLVRPPLAEITDTTGLTYSRMLRLLRVMGAVHMVRPAAQGSPALYELWLPAGGRLHTDAAWALVAERGWPWTRHRARDTGKATAARRAKAAARVLGESFDGTTTTAAAAAGVAYPPGPAETRTQGAEGARGAERAGSVPFEAGREGAASASVTGQGTAWTVPSGERVDGPLGDRGGGPAGDRGDGPPPYTGSPVKGRGTGSGRSDRPACARDTDEKRQLQEPGGGFSAGWQAGAPGWATQAQVDAGCVLGLCPACRRNRRLKGPEWMCEDCVAQGVPDESREAR